MSRDQLYAWVVRRALQRQYARLPVIRLQGLQLVNLPIVVVYHAGYRHVVAHDYPDILFWFWRLSSPYPYRAW